MTALRSDAGTLLASEASGHRLHHALPAAECPPWFAASDEG